MTMPSQTTGHLQRDIEEVMGYKITIESSSSHETFSIKSRRKSRSQSQGCLFSHKQQRPEPITLLFLVSTYCRYVCAYGIPGTDVIILKIYISAQEIGEKFLIFRMKFVSRTRRKLAKIDGY
jgi:hypothetical protein